MTEGLTTNHSVNDKLKQMFNKTSTLSSKPALSGMDNKPSHLSKVSHGLIVEASDADIELPSGKKVIRLQRNQSGIIIKDRALSSEFTHLGSANNSPV